MSRVFVISGPSGVGKGTLCQRILAEHPQLGLTLSVSMTSRQPRPGEMNGQHYHFVTRKAFEHAIAEGDMLEWAEYNGQLYGTPRQSVATQLAQGCPVLLEIEPQGAFQVRRLFPTESVLIFILPPSWAVLQQRLQSRGVNSEADMASRLAIAQQEMAQQALFDETLVNDQLDEAVAQLAQRVATHLTGHGLND